MTTDQQQAAATEAQAFLTKIGASYANLTGSEKQIAWATEIRMFRTLKLASYLGEVESHQSNKGADGQATIKATKDACIVTLGNSDAKFWIDNREFNAKNLFSEGVAAALKKHGSKEAVVKAYNLTM